MLLAPFLWIFCEFDEKVLDNLSLEIYLRVNKDNIASQKVMLNNGAYIAGEDEAHLFMRIPK